MGCQLSKADSDLLKSQAALLKAYIYKKSSLENDLNSLKIRQNYSKFNPCKRNFKKMFTIRIVIKNLMMRARLTKNKLSKHSEKVHGYLPVIDSYLINEFKLGSNQLVENLTVAIQSEVSKIYFLKEKLENLRDRLIDNKKKIEKNQKLIEDMRIDKELCVGKLKKMQLLKVVNENGLSEKGGLRIDSVSTAANESFGHIHVKNSFSMKTEDLNLEKTEYPILDIPTQIPKRLFNNFCPIKSIQLCESAILLRDKLLIKKDMESFIKKNKKIMKKSMKKIKNLVNRYESVEYAFKTDPQAYLSKLLKEIHVRQHDLNTILCKNDHIKALISFGKNEEESREDLQVESILTHTN